MEKLQDKMETSACIILGMNSFFSFSFYISVVKKKRLLTSVLCLFFKCFFLYSCTSEGEVESETDLISTLPLVS